MQPSASQFARKLEATLPFEIDFLPVGNSNADAILLRYGNPLTGHTVHLIDGGYTGTADTIIKHINSWYGGAPIDHMILSHADDDHATGLVEVLKRHPVRNLWMNRPWRSANQVVDKFHGNYTVSGLINKMRELHPYLVEMGQIAAQKGVPVREAFQGTQIGSFWVMAPSQERYFGLIPEDKTPQSYGDAAKTFGQIFTEAAETALTWIQETWGTETLGDDLSTSASNETSLVQWADIDGKRILLTADVGPQGLAEAADYAEINGILTPPHFIQVPHHGSRHNVSRTTLSRWLGDPLPQGSAKRGTAFCSAGDGDDAAKYPRRVVSNAFRRRGYPVHVTGGTGKRHHHQMLGRQGWSSSQAIPFFDMVEA
jgi:beta-lactamase superfamily II metal-dependent hydrolase